MNDHSDTDDTGDGEGVWSPDIEQCFREALLLFPPCGRRKHILQEEGGGKMYGRNELIARHIRMRTGKIRTRKQVSSHIQVLARRKAKAEASTNGISAAGSDSPASSVTGPIRMSSRPGSTASNNQHFEQSTNQQQTYYDVWADRPIVTQKIRLVEFSAFVEYRKNHQPNPMTQPSNQQNSGLASLASAALAMNSINDSDLPTLSHGQSSIIKSEANSVHTQPALPNSCQIPLATIASSQQHSLMMQTTGSATGYVQDNNFEGGQPAATPIIASSVSLSTIPESSSNSMSNNGHQQPLNTSQKHYQQQNLRNQQETDNDIIMPNNIVTNTMVVNTDYLQENIHNHQQNHQQHQLVSHTAATGGLTRHSYVKIDYRLPYSRQTNKLETIALSQIQDKFPEIGGSEGIFQRGSPDAFFLVKFWADLNCDYDYNADDQNSYFGFSCHFETIEAFKDITCSTKACSYGLQVVEKVEKVYCAFNSANGRYSYEIKRSPMCEFMIKFIRKLRQLPRTSQMNSVLENFTVLQEITSESTSEVMLCLAYVFEIASLEQDNGSQYRVYKLTKD